jgi:hypothetical protein
MVHADTAPDVLELGRLWAEPGASYATVADALNAQGRYYIGRKKRPGKWTAARVRQIVMNALFYLGYIMPRGGRAKRRAVKLAGDGTLVERYARAYNAQRTSNIQPIWDDELGERIIAKRMVRQRRGRRPVGDAVFLLTPLLHFGDVQMRAQRRGHLRYYATRSAPRVSFDAGAIDESIIARLRGVAFPPLVRRHITQMVEAAHTSGTRAEAQATLRAATDEIEGLARMQANPKLRSADDVFERLMSEAIARRDAARRALDAPSEVEQLMSRLGDLGTRIAAMTPGQQRGLIHSMFERIDLGEDGAVKSITPRAWLRAAFRSLAEKLPSLTPTGVAPSFGNVSDETVWLVEVVTISLR